MRMERCRMLYLKNGSKLARCGVVRPCFLHDEPIHSRKVTPRRVFAGAFWAGISLIRKLWRTFR